MTFGKHLLILLVIVDMSTFAGTLSTIRALVLLSIFSVSLTVNRLSKQNFDKYESYSIENGNTIFSDKFFVESGNLLI